MATYEPFVGFTYNDIHSSDLKIYRVSSGNRYDDNITATMTDKTVDVPGGDGQYYFGTTFKNRTFKVDYVFDNLRKADIQEIKRVFCGDGVHDLVFDEDRDEEDKALKIWSAKVTGTASMKHLCFDEVDENGKPVEVYKGEGSITFTCYYPYARKEYTVELKARQNASTYPPYNPNNNKNKFEGEVPTTFIATFTLHPGIASNSMKDILFYTGEEDTPEYKITLSKGIAANNISQKVIWNSKTGLVTFDGKVIASTGPTLLKVKPTDRMRFRIKNGDLYPSQWDITVKYDALYR